MSDSVGTPSISDPRPAGNTAPTPRYHRITPIICHDGSLLQIADGVIELGAVAFLGQVRGRGLEFVVAPFLRGATPAYVAPLGWQADITATASTEDGGSTPPPTPAGAAPIRFDIYQARRRALLVEAA